MDGALAPTAVFQSLEERAGRDFSPLIPAKAGTQVFLVLPAHPDFQKKAWVPAFAGMSGTGGLA